MPGPDAIAASTSPAPGPGRGGTVLYIYPFMLKLGAAFKTETDAVSHPISPFPRNWVILAGTGTRPERSPGAYLLWPVTIPW